MPIDDEAALGQAKGCLNVDLLSSSRNLVKLLIAVDCFPHGGLYSGPCAEAAARRYEQHWLPLLASATAKSEADAAQLVPPLDVAYVWLCHRLAPAAYEADCKYMFGRTLDPVNAEQALAFDDGTSTKGAATKQAWMHNQPVESKSYRREPYWPPSLPVAVQVMLAPKRNYTPETLERATQEMQSSGRKYRISRLLYDVVAAMGRQGEFLRNVLRACYSEEPFLQRAVDRYLRFLVLWKENPGLKVVPMYDIDLMWHAHMAHSGVYRGDMQAFNGGKVLNHDDSLESPELSNGFAATKAAFEARWDMLYNPPLTQKVPAKERHPAEQLVGPSVLCVLSGPLPEEIEYLRAADKVRKLKDAVKAAGARAKEVRTQGRKARTSQAVTDAMKKTQVAKLVTKAAVDQYNAAITEPRSLAITARTARAQHNQQYCRQGGAALYCLYLIKQGRQYAEQHPGCCGFLCGWSAARRARYIEKEAVRHMLKVMRGIPAFKPGCGPFSDSHPFWSEFTLVPYDTPITVWRTPPGSAPGTLQAALNAAAAAKGTTAPVVGIPVQTGIPVQQTQQQQQAREADGVVVGGGGGYVPGHYPPYYSPAADPLLTYVLVSYTFSDLYCASNDNLDRAMSPGYCPYDSCAVGGDWAAHPHAPGDASGGAAAGVVGGVGGGDSALLLPGDITASPASLGCGVVPPESCVSSIYSGAGYGSTYTTEYGVFKPTSTSSACAGSSTCGSSCGGAGSSCGGCGGGGGG